jgi:inner membrane transporter RhtA
VEAVTEIRAGQPESGVGSADPAPRSRLAGAGLVLLGVFSVQWGAGLAKSLFPVAGPSGTVWLRLAFSALALALLLWRPGRPVWSFRDLPDPAGARRAVILFGLVLGGMNWSFYQALDRIPLGAAVAVEFLGPLTLTLALSRRRVDVLWALAAAAGLVLLTLDPFAGRADLHLAPVGVLFALLAGALWAAYILLAERVGRLVPGSRGLGGALLVSFLVATPTGIPAVPRLLDGQVLLLGLGVALLSTVVPYAAELEALRRLPARAFGVLLSLEPAAAAMVGLLVLHERLDGWRWAGVGLVCAASLGATLTSGKKDAA